MADSEDPVQPPAVGLALIIGLLGGAALGANAAAAHCCFAWLVAEFWSSVAITAAIGAVVGTVVGFLASQPGMPRLFSVLGLVAGIVPALQFLSGPEGRAAGALGFLALPGGLLLGAFFDRAIDELRSGEKRQSLSPLIKTELNEGLDRQVWRLERIELKRTSRNTYSGTAEVKGPDGPESLSVDAIDEGETFSYKLRPARGPQ